MPKFHVPVRRTVTTYGSFQVEAADQDEAAAKARALLDKGDPEDMGTGESMYDEVMRDEIELVN